MTTITQNLCPRCGGMMRPVMDVRSTVFEGCLMCGYEDYGHEQPKAKPTPDIYQFRYGGSEPFLTEWDKVITAQLVTNHRFNTVGYRPTCPFCDEGMDQISLSGKRIDLLEERFLCKNGHRISLVPNRAEDRIEWL